MKVTTRRKQVGREGRRTTRHAVKRLLKGGKARSARGPRWKDGKRRKDIPEHEDFE